MTIESIRASAAGDTTFDEQLRFLLAEIERLRSELKAAKAIIDDLEREVHSQG